MANQRELSCTSEDFVFRLNRSLTAHRESWMPKLKHQWISLFSSLGLTDPVHRSTHTMWAGRKKTSRMANEVQALMQFGENTASENVIVCSHAVNGQSCTRGLHRSGPLLCDQRNRFLPWSKGKLPPLPCQIAECANNQIFSCAKEEMESLPVNTLPPASWVKSLLQLTPILLLQELARLPPS